MEIIRLYFSSDNFDKYNMKKYFSFALFMIFISANTLANPFLDLKNFFINTFSNLDINQTTSQYTNSPVHCENRSFTTDDDERSLEDKFESLGGDLTALKQAQCFFNTYKETEFNSAGPGGKVKIQNECIIVINDHTSGSREGRMFIVDQCENKVDVMSVTRGFGGGGEFGNNHNSNMTSDGFMVTGGLHHSPSGKVWSPGIKLHGLQKDINHNTYSRGVVIHRAITERNGEVFPYCNGGGLGSSFNNEYASEFDGRCGFSSGCPAVDPENWPFLYGKVLGTSSGGTLVHNYTPNMKEKGASYCGDSLWK